MNDSLSGVADTNDNGQLGSTFTTGFLPAPDPTTGRAAVTLTINQTATHWAYYVVSANTLNLIALDSITTPANLVLQQMLRQSQSSFSNADLNATSVYATSGLAQTQNGNVPDVVLGLLTTDGNGDANLVADENQGGTISQPAAGWTYSVATDGSVELDGLGVPPILYLVSPNQAFVLGQDNSVALGYLQPQSGAPFTDGSVMGTYRGGTVVPVASAITDSITYELADGNENLNGTQDTSGPSGTGTQNFSYSYQVDQTGRAVEMESGNQVGILYVISPTKIAFLPTSDPNPALSVLTGEP
jgi:hypothetical protein